MNEQTSDQSRPSHDEATLHPILSGIALVMAKQRSALLEAAAAIDASQRAQAPSDDDWSAAEVLEHLAITEDSVGRLFSVSARRIRESDTPLEASTDARSIIDGFQRFSLDMPEERVPAPGSVTPTGSVSFADALSALERSRSRLFGAMQKASGLALGTSSAPHPKLGSLTMYEWLLMVAMHEARHTKQLTQIRFHFETMPDA